jgi:K+-transporting ATPase KdpF subunit
LEWYGFWSAGVKSSWTIRKPERRGKEAAAVLLLGLIILLLFGYLVYALAHPERF